MQEMNPDTVLEQAAPAADPEPQAVRPAEDTSIPSAPEAPAAEAAAPQPEAPAEPAPVTVVDIRFRNNAKSYFFDPNGLTLAVGDHVIIDTARGDEFGICAAGNHAVRPRELVLPLRKVLRAATAQDERINAENQEKEKKAFDVCQQKILSHKLDMQLVSAECAFDGSKILFFFTAEGRVDFRELVKDLASAFRTRIELRQIGVRDKAKMVGGLGVCGRPFCCKEFLDDFQLVSIKMAKTQNLSLNPTKISGTCGRLMCCLKYEQEAYEDLIKTAPKAESFVDTPDGRGTVIEVNLLRQSVKVRMEDHPETIGSYKNTDIYIIRNGKARKNDPPIPKDLAPISSRPRPAQKKKEAFFEELPEVIYSDAVASSARSRRPRRRTPPRSLRQMPPSPPSAADAAADAAISPPPTARPPKPLPRPRTRPAPSPSPAVSARRRTAPRRAKSPTPSPASPSRSSSRARTSRKSPTPRPSADADAAAAAASPRVNRSRRKANNCPDPGAASGRAGIFAA